MTDKERLNKNLRIKEAGKATRLKRKGQICKVFRVKIDSSHLNQQQRTALKMMFVEAKWLHNDILTFMNTRNIRDYNDKVKVVQGLDKSGNQVTHELNYLGSQLKQAVIQGIKNNMKALSVLKSHQRKTGKLRYKSNFTSIELQQYGITYKFYDHKYVKIQGIKGKVRIVGAEQFFSEPGIEYANAKLLNLPGGYYLVVTTYREKSGSKEFCKAPIGIDMGIKTSITTSEGEKIDVCVEEPERLKKLQRKMMRQTKGSNNRYKTRKLLQREYQKMGNAKKDIANKIVHDLLEHEKVYMQDENISGWHKGLFGRKVQHSVLGLVKAKLIRHERVVVLDKMIPTTKRCPCCGRLNKEITLNDRIFECPCGYREDRDIHAARNMILLAS